MFQQVGNVLVIQQRGAWHGYSHLIKVPRQGKVFNGCAG